MRASKTHDQPDGQIRFDKILKILIQVKQEDAKISYASAKRQVIQENPALFSAESPFNFGDNPNE
jgi:hypothetical protein